jgi:hypothetical protein
MIIVAQKMGLLGNMLEQYAHLIAFYKEHGVPISQMGFTDYATHFEYPSQDLFCRYPVRRTIFNGIRARRAAFYLLIGLGRLNLLRWIPGAAVVTMDWQSAGFDLSSPEFIALTARKKWVFLRGGWQHRYWTAYEKHIDTIREFFEIAEPYRSNVRALAEKLKEATGDITVGVHLRQGDLRFDPVRKDFFTTPQYIKVMQKTVHLFPGKKVIFLICSDVTQNPADFAEFTVLYGTGHLVEDMYSLAECDYIIGTRVTSFSGWASMMGNKPMYRLVDADLDFTLSDFTVVLRQP